MNDRITVVLGMGGTIAGQGQGGHAGHLDYRAGQRDIALLVRDAGQAPGRLHTEQVAQIDSKDLQFVHWQRLLERVRHWLAQPEVGGLVITHGTDTLEETAFFLQAVLMPTKPVVLTCAMRPATALSPDGPQNLADALCVAASGWGGVVVVCAGRILAADRVRKVHPYRLDAFSSGEDGPMGYVEDSGVRWALSRPAAPMPIADDALDLVVNADLAAWPWVEILHHHAGADGRVVDALLQAGVAGLVVAGTGNGTLSEALEVALLRAQEAGLPVLRSTRCVEGRVLPTQGDRLPATPLAPAQARIALLLSLLGGRKLSLAGPAARGT